MFGAIVTALMIPLSCCWSPKHRHFSPRGGQPARWRRSTSRSPRFRQPGDRGAAARSREGATGRRSRTSSRKPALRKVTLLLAFGYMFHTITFYYILKWSPQIVADFGYPPPQAASVLTWANVGGAIGGFLFGFLMTKWDIKWPTIAMLLPGSIAVAAFGICQGYAGGLADGDLRCRFFTNAAIVGYYAAFARGFPAYARATGTGVVLGVGRFGAAGSPILAGLLFSGLGKDQLLAVSIIMAIGSIIAALLFFVLPLRDADRDQIAQAAGGEPAPLKTG